MTHICTLALAIATVASVMIPREAAAQITLSPNGCQTYAVWSGNLVWASDLGADKEKARADLVARDQKTPASIFALMLQNIDALWDTAADWEEVTVALLKDCIARRGTYSTTGG